MHFDTNAKISKISDNFGKNVEHICPTYIMNISRRYIFYREGCRRKDTGHKTWGRWR